MVIILGQYTKPLEVIHALNLLCFIFIISLLRSIANVIHNMTMSIPSISVRGITTPCFTSTSSHRVYFLNKIYNRQVLTNQRF